MDEFAELVAEFLGMRPGRFVDTSSSLMLLKIREGLSAIGVIATVEEIESAMTRQGISISEKANPGGTHWLIYESPSEAVNMDLCIGDAP